MSSITPWPPFPAQTYKPRLFYVAEIRSDQAFVCLLHKQMRIQRIYEFWSVAIEDKDTTCHNNTALNSTPCCWSHAEKINSTNPADNLYLFRESWPREHHWGIKKKGKKINFKYCVIFICVIGKFFYNWGERPWWGHSLLHH